MFKNNLFLLAFTYPIQIFTETSICKQTRFFVTEVKGPQISIQWVHSYYLFIVVFKQFWYDFLHYWWVICHHLYNHCATKNQKYSHFYVYIIFNVIIHTYNHTLHKEATGGSVWNQCKFVLSKVKQSRILILWVYS